MDLRCTICNKIFSKRSNLNRHRKTVHKNNEIVTVAYNKDIAIFKCLEGCNVCFKCNMDLRLHLQIKHGIHIEMVNINFKTYEDFRAWLKMEQKNRNIKYFKSRGSCQGKQYKKMYFNCIRSGKKRIKPLNGEKSREGTQKSCKMNMSCTSQIILTKHDNGVCNMKYFRNHYGHNVTTASTAPVDQTPDNETIRHVSRIIEHQIKKSLTDQIITAASEVIHSVQTKDYSLGALDNILNKLKSITSKNSVEPPNQNETTTQTKPSDDLPPIKRKLGSPNMVVYVYKNTINNVKMNVNNINHDKELSTDKNTTNVNNLNYDKEINKEVSDNKCYISKEPHNDHSYCLF